MKKIIAREFLWLLGTLVLALPLSLIFIEALHLVSAGERFTEAEKIFVQELYIIAYVFCFIGVYLVRFIVLAIKTIATS